MDRYGAIGNCAAAPTRRPSAGTPAADRLTTAVNLLIYSKLYCKPAALPRALRSAPRPFAGAPALGAGQHANSWPIGDKTRKKRLRKTGIRVAFYYYLLKTPPLF